MFSSGKNEWKIWSSYHILSFLNNDKNESLSALINFFSYSCSYSLLVVSCNPKTETVLSIRLGHFILECCMWWLYHHYVVIYGIILLHKIIKSCLIFSKINVNLEFAGNFLEVLDLGMAHLWCIFSSSNLFVS